MIAKHTDILMQNTIFYWIALVTGLTLLIPLVAMQFTSEVNWTIGDFVVMGMLLFGTGNLCVLTARRVRSERRVMVGVAFALAFLWLWAELAVGVFTNWGS